MREVGTVGKISDCQPGGPGFNPCSGRGFTFWLPSFATLTGTLSSVVVSQRSIGERKRTHIHLMARLMPVLWTVTSSLINNLL